MTAIPEDVMAAALEIADRLWRVHPKDLDRMGYVADAVCGSRAHYYADEIARAILAERQRCAEAVNGEMLSPENHNYLSWDDADMSAEIALRRVSRAILGAQD